MEIAAGIVQVLLGLLFAFSGGSKVAGMRMQIDNFNRYGYPQWFRVFTGIVELAGAAGMVVGLFAEEVAIDLGCARSDDGWRCLHRPAEVQPVSVVAPVVLLVSARLS